eukprot:jgi/Hompol1/5803/HPOL_001928-RA
MVEVAEFVKTQLALIESERQAEIQEVNAMHAAYTLLDLQRRGVVLLALRISGIRSGLGGRTLVDIESGVGGASLLPPHKFR